MPARPISNIKFYVVLAQLGTAVIRYGRVPLVISHDKVRQFCIFWLELNEERDKLRQIYFIVHCRTLSNLVVHSIASKSHRTFFS